MDLDGCLEDKTAEAMGTSMGSPGLTANWAQYYSRLSRDFYYVRSSSSSSSSLVGRVVTGCVRPAETDRKLPGTY